MYKPIDMDDLKLNQNFKWVVEKKNFFSQDDCDYMIDYINNESTRKKGHYTGGEADSMDESVCMLNISEAYNQKYLDMFWTAIKIADATTYKYDIKGIYKNRLQAHRYNVGDWYNPHSDFHPIQQFSSVKLTLSLIHI